MPRSRSLAELIEQNRSTQAGMTAGPNFASTESQPMQTTASGGSHESTPETVGENAEEALEKVKKLAVLFGG